MSDLQPACNQVLTNIQPEGHPMADEGTPPRAFTQFLLEQRRGALHEDLTERLAETVASVIEHGKAGEVRLTLRIKPAGDGMVSITDGVVVKQPEGEKSPSMFYVDDVGGVHRQDPRQIELPLRKVADVAEAVGE